MTKYTSDDSNFGAEGPFFRIIRQGLEGLARGEDYFDLLANEVVFEYVISVPGYPRRVEGRQGVIRPVPRLRRLHDGAHRRQPPRLPGP